MAMQGHAGPAPHTATNNFRTAVLRRFRFKGGACLPTTAFGAGHDVQKLAEADLGRTLHFRLLSTRTYIIPVIAPGVHNFQCDRIMTPLEITSDVL
jgi:hypothetical protein